MVNQIALEIKRQKQRQIKRQLLSEYARITEKLIEKKKILDSDVSELESLEHDLETLVRGTAELQARLDETEATLMILEPDETEPDTERVLRFERRAKRLREKIEQLNARITNRMENAQRPSEKTDFLLRKIDYFQKQIEELVKERDTLSIEKRAGIEKSIVEAMEIQKTLEQKTLKSDEQYTQEELAALFEAKDRLAELALLGIMDNPYSREASLSDFHGATTAQLLRTRYLLTHSWTKYLHPIDPDPVMSLTRFFQCKTLILACAPGYKRTAVLRIMDYETVRLVIPKQEQLGFAARLFGTTFFEYIYRTHHIPMGDLLPWQPEISPIFDELFTGVLSPTFGVLSGYQSLQKADQLPMSIIDGALRHGISDWEDQRHIDVLTKGLLATLADSVAHTDDDDYKTEISRFLESPSARLWEFEEDAKNTDPYRWPRRGSITTDFILGILKDLYPKIYDYIKNSHANA